MSDIGAKIRRARRAAGLSLRDVSTRTGFSIAYLSDIELEGSVCPTCGRSRR